ncbi:MAG: hypothetical protein JJV99_07545, partial [Colwellia sp.]|nr:hypothetical protein [Colwellia sp.]
MKKNSFSTQLLKGSFTVKEWQKGQKLINSNCVIACALDGNVIRGVVRSERNKNDSYMVRIELDQNANIANAICNCFVGYDCKHGAALAQYYIQDHSFPTDSHSTTYINKISTNKTDATTTDATTNTKTVKNNLLKGDSTQIINTWLDQFQDNKPPSFSGNKAFLYFIRH